MTDHGPCSIPPTSTLLAFESAARHGNFSRAARELETSQSAVSRHVARLETQLGARLFERSRTGVDLTEAGRRFRDAVAVGLGALRAGTADAAALSREARPEVAIACTDEVSQLFLMPRYQELSEALGELVRVRIQVHSAMGHVPPRPPADVVLAWEAGISTPEDRVVVAREALRPFSSPDYAAKHAETLNRPVAGWGGLTFLSFARPGEGAESWKPWFAGAGCPATRPRYEEFDVYTYALEAAVAGRGLVLGWRHLIGRHVESGALVGLGDGFVETARCFTVALTPEGRQRPPARACLGLFGGAM
ncbi:MAG: LysR family transcriptional regulator [Rhodospirillales bacterium]|nr:LysR family transcriptional regulator [Rhodospirillales bacterium]